MTIANIRPCLKTLGLAMTVLLGACAQPNDLTVVGGRMIVLGPDPKFSAEIMQGETPDGWMIEGARVPGNLSIAENKGLPQLVLRSSRESFSALRRTKASLLASPYLTWTWRADAPTGAEHPIRLTIGLAERAKPRSGRWWSLNDDPPLGVSRIISIAWGRSALGRGTLRGPIRRKGNPEVIVYTHRGGPEQSRQWWTDTVDLSLIHRQMWPADKQDAMEIRFIGFTGNPVADAKEMRFANITLTR